MLKLLVIFLFLFIGAVTSGAEDGSRAGNTRGYDVDVLLDTFGYGADDIDVDVA